MSTMQILMIVIWSLVLIATIVIEFETADMVTIWFSVGAIGALIAAALDQNVVMQIGIFIAVSLVLIVLTRPMTKRFMDKTVIKTNADRFVGMIGTITVDVPVGGRGEVLVDNSKWIAFSSSEEIIPVGTKVVVQDIVGIKLLVSKVDQDEKIWLKKE
ncbi:MAG TPA: NfeD family protein [Bacilli bacterium]|nr:NfeD family protein [Bacilli bacterium]